MAKDFRASQVQTTQIVASGSSSTNARIVMYSVEGQSTVTPNQGVIDSDKFGTGSIGNDIFLFVSGGIGEKDGSANAIAVFGGDVHISGNLTSDQTIIGAASESLFRFQLVDYATTTNTSSNPRIAGQVIFPGNEFTGSLTLRAVLSTTDTATTASIRLFNATSGAYVELQSGVDELTTTNLAPTIVESQDLYTAVNFAPTTEAVYELHLHTDDASDEVLVGGGELRPSGSFTNVVVNNFVSGTWIDNNNRLRTTASVAINGEAGFADSVGADVYFYVSGTFGSGSASDRIAVFGGDVRISGTLAVGTGSAFIAEDRVTLTSASMRDVAGQLTFFDDNNLAGQTLTDLASGAGATSFWQSTTNNLIFTTGSAEVTGSVLAKGGLSGSLTTLSDGSPYLLAGDNITLVTNSLGQIAISGAAGGGSTSTNINTTVEPDRYYAFTTGSLLWNSTTWASVTDVVTFFSESSTNTGIIRSGSTFTVSSSGRYYWNSLFNTYALAGGANIGFRLSGSSGTIIQHAAFNNADQGPGVLQGILDLQAGESFTLEYAFKSTGGAASAWVPNDPLDGENMRTGEITMFRIDNAVVPPVSGSEWITLYDVDFTSLANQDIQANGNLAITGSVGVHTWIRENSGATTFMSISNGTGLQISLNTTNSDFNNTTRSAPLLALPLSGVFPQGFNFDEVDVRIDSVISSANQGQDFESLKTVLEISSALASPYNIGLTRVFSTALQQQFSVTTAGTSTNSSITNAGENAFRFLVLGLDGADSFTAITPDASIPNSDQYQSRARTYWDESSNGQLLDPAVPENLRDLNYVFVVGSANTAGDMIGTLKRLRIQYRPKGGVVVTGTIESGGGVGGSTLTEAYLSGSSIDIYEPTGSVRISGSAGTNIPILQLIPTNARETALGIRDASDSENLIMIHGNNSTFGGAGIILKSVGSFSSRVEWQDNSPDPTTGPKAEIYYLDQNDELIIAHTSVGGKTILQSSAGLEYLTVESAGSGRIHFFPNQSGGVHFNSGSAVVSGTVRSIGGFSGSLTTLSDGSPYLLAGDNITLVTNSQGQIAISSSAGGGGGPDSDWTSNGSNALRTTSSVAVSSETEFASGAGADVYFYVSGTFGSGSASDRIVLFGGDVKVSGTLSVGTGSLFLQDDRVVFTSASIQNIGGILTFFDDSNLEGQTLSELAAGADEFFFSNTADIVETTGSIEVTGSAEIKANLFVTGNVTMGAVTTPNLFIDSAARRVAINTNVFTDGITADTVIASDDTTGGVATLKLLNAAGTNGLPFMSFVEGTTDLGNIAGHDTVEFGLVNGITLGPSTGRQLGVRIGSTNVGRWSATGLFVTGTLRTTGDFSTDGTATAADGLSVGSGSLAAPSLTTIGVNQVISMPYDGWSAARNSADDGWVPMFKIGNSLLGDGGTDQLQIGNSAQGGFGSLLGIALVTNDGNTSNMVLQHSGVFVETDAGFSIISNFVSGDSFAEEKGADNFFFVSGAVGSRGSAVRGVSVFGGDAHVSGGLTVGVNAAVAGTARAEGNILAAGIVTASLGFSGSLTTLTDGSPYLIAGSNITLATGSNGAVTITSTATGGGGGGSSAIVFNNIGITDYASTANTSSLPEAVGQLCFDSSQHTSPFYLSAVLTAASASVTASIKLLNLDDQTFVDIGGSGVDQINHIGTTSTKVSSVDLANASGFNALSSSVYELQLFTSNGNIPVTLGGAFFNVTSSLQGVNVPGNQLQLGITDYATTDTTSSTTIGQISYRGSEYSGSVHLSALVSAASASVSASVRLYNLDDFAYVEIGGAGQEHLSVTTTTPTQVYSVNLKNAANFNALSSSNYELQLSSSNEGTLVAAGAAVFRVTGVVVTAEPSRLSLGSYTVSTATSSNPQAVGGGYMVPSEHRLSEVYLRTILSTTTGSDTALAQLFNVTSGALVHIGGTDITEISTSNTTPTNIQSVDLTSATNFDISTASVYEVRLYGTGSTSPTTIIHNSELVFS